MRISGTIPILVMMANDRNDWIRKIDRGKNVGSDAGMQLHPLEFSHAQPAGFVEDVFRDCDFPHVVKERRRFDGLYLHLIGNSDLSRQVHRDSLHAADVRERFTALGMEAIGGTPEEFGAYIKSEIKKWEKVVKASGAKPD